MRNPPMYPPPRQPPPRREPPRQEPLRQEPARQEPLRQEPARGARRQSHPGSPRHQRPQEQGDRHYPGPARDQGYLDPPRDERYPVARDQLRRGPPPGTWQGDLTHPRLPRPPRDSSPRRLSATRPERVAPEGREGGLHVRNGRASHRSARLDLRSVSAVLLCTIAGLALVRQADVRAVHGASYDTSVYLFWAGLILIFAPAATRVLMRGTARAERLTLVLLLGVALYLVKIQGSPNAFTFFDEYIHLRNTQDILRTTHLFQYNPLLPTAAYYPGLAAVAATIVNLTGLSTFAAGLITIGVARLIISACFYLVAEGVTGSSRGAGAASLIYAANPMFLFWSSSFAYEDLALPLAAFVVWWISRTRALHDRLAAQAITVVAIVAVTVTHHVSAFALAGILAVLFFAERLLRHPPAERRYLGVFAAFTGLIATFWFFLVAKPAWSYIYGKNIAPVLRGVASIISGHSGGRTLYSATVSPPVWYILAGFAAIGIIMAALLPAVLRAWRILRSRSFTNTPTRRASIAVAAIIAASFPLTLLPRFTAAGGAVSSRTSEYVFTGMGCILALLLQEAKAPATGRFRWIKRLAPTGGRRTLFAIFLVTMIFIGDVTIGSSFFALLPTPANVPGFPPNIQPDMISAANWARQHLGTDQTFATDVDNELSLATYGDENTVPGDKVYPIFFVGNITKSVVRLIKVNNIHYLLLDWRATRGRLPQSTGYYYSQWEPHAGTENYALPTSYLEKFSIYTCTRLVYEAGPIQIIDVSRIEDGSCTPIPLGSVPPGKKPPSKKQGKTTARGRAAS